MKNIFLKILIVVLSLCSILGIAMVFKGMSSASDLKLVGTGGAVFIFSALAFFNYLLYDNDKYKSFSILGMVVSLITFIWILLAIWGVIDICLLICTDNSSNLEITESLILLTLFVTYSSLMLLIKNENKMIQITQGITIVLSLIGNALLIVLIWGLIKSSNLYTNMLMTFGILSALSTIILLILNKMYHTKSETNYVNTNFTNNNIVEQLQANTITNSFGQQPKIVVGPKEAPSNSFVEQPQVCAAPSNIVGQQPAVNPNNNSFGSIPNNTVVQQPQASIPNNAFVQPQVTNAASNDVQIPSINNVPNNTVQQPVNDTEQL